MKLILASASPRRADLLRQVAIPFIVEIPLVNESAVDIEFPEKLVMKLAEEKALSVFKRVRSGIILAADTVVVHKGVILGKPSGREEAKEMLQRLSGDRHDVYTGLALLNTASEIMEKGVEKTTVWLKKINSEDLEWYLNSGEALDKAGAYGIQGRAALFVKRIEGCYSNVVGLPLSLLSDLAEKMNIPIK
jgi:septum formation protein